MNKELSVYVTLENWRDVNSAFTLSIRSPKLLKYLNREQHTAVTFLVPSKDLDIFEADVREIYTKNGIKIKSVVIH